MAAIIIRIARQLFNDKRSLILMLFAPMFIMTFLYLIFGESDYKPKLMLLEVPSNIEAAIAKQDVIIVDSKTTSIDEILSDDEADGVLYTKDGLLKLRIQKPDAIKSPKLTKAISDALKNLGGIESPLEVDYLYGSGEESAFNSLGYMFLGVFSFFFVFLISGISFIRERIFGTIERFMLAPISRFQVVGGYILGFGVFAVAQSIFVILYSRFILSMPIEGSIFAAIILMVLLALVAVVIGAVVSVFANNEFQVVQFIPIVVIPQIFFSGLIPVDTLPFHLDKLAFATPVYYACAGLELVMVRGGSFLDVLPYCGALLVFICLLFILNVQLLRKYRSI